MLFVTTWPTAALVAGAGVGAGIIDRLEARRWERAEDAREVRIFLVLRPTALIASMGVQDAYALPRARTPRDDEPEDFPGTFL